MMCIHSDHTLIVSFGLWLKFFHLTMPSGPVPPFLFLSALSLTVAFLWLTFFFLNPVSLVVREKMPMLS